MKQHLNLLPWSYRRRCLARRRLLQWSLVWGIILAATGALLGTKYRSYQTAARAREAAIERCLPLNHLMAESARLRRDIGQLRARGALAAQFEHEQPMLTLLDIARRSVQRCDGRLVVRQLAFQRVEPQQPTAAASAQAPPPQQASPATSAPCATVVFKGDAVDNLAVATFGVGLRDAGMFRKVELKSSQGIPSGRGRIRSYLLECEI